MIFRLGIMFEFLLGLRVTRNFKWWLILTGYQIDQTTYDLTGFSLYLRTLLIFI